MKNRQVQRTDRGCQEPGARRSACLKASGSSSGGDGNVVELVVMGCTVCECCLKEKSLDCH